MFCVLQITFAKALPPSPDPSQFKFNQAIIKQLDGGNDSHSKLVLNMRLFGGMLAPFMSRQMDIVAASFQQLADSSIGKISPD